jgi:hypothetical protein
MHRCNLMYRPIFGTEKRLMSCRDIQHTTRELSSNACKLLGQFNHLMYSSCHRGHQLLAAGHKALSPVLPCTCRTCRISCHAASCCHCFRLLASSCLAWLAWQCQVGCRTTPPPALWGPAVLQRQHEAAWGHNNHQPQPAFPSRLPSTWSVGAAGHAAQHRTGKRPAGKVVHHIH